MNDSTMSRSAVREVDRIAIEEFELPGIVLMENAGRNSAELLLRQDVGGPVAICCGKGNNGGDGFVITRHLENQGVDVQVLLVADPAELTGDAAVNCRVLQHAGTPLHVFDRDQEAEQWRPVLHSSDWIVDALLGTGMTGAVREPYAGIIREINAAEARVLAVDVPSGLDCDTGRPLGDCVRADCTATFVARKTGFDADSAAEWLGAVHVIDIGVPRAAIARVRDSHANR